MCSSREISPPIFCFFASGGSGSVPARRAELYSKMARDLDERGAAFLKGGETSQSLTLSDLFDTADDGTVVPRLKVWAHPLAAHVG